MAHIANTKGNQHSKYKILNFSLDILPGRHTVARARPPLAPSPPQILQNSKVFLLLIQQINAEQRVTDAHAGGQDIVYPGESMEMWDHWLCAHCFLLLLGYDSGHFYYITNDFPTSSRDWPLSLRYISSWFISYCSFVATVVLDVTVLLTEMLKS